MRKIDQKWSKRGKNQPKIMIIGPNMSEVMKPGHMIGKVLKSGRYGPEMKEISQNDEK